MSLSIDHIVILVSDLETAQADYTALGFKVVPGGEHTGGATHNALIAFADGSYFELIAFKQPAPEHRWWRYNVLGEGLIDFALLPSTIESDVAAARQRGLAIEGPVAGGRLRPDGQEIKWQNATPATPDLPFMCGDVTPRNLRVPAGEAWQHPNDVKGVGAITVAVSNLEVSTAYYQALLGIEPQATNAPHGEGQRRVAFPLGSAFIILAEPVGDSWLTERLQQHGEGPCAITLLADNPVNLDATKTHGVRFN